AAASRDPRNLSGDLAGKIRRVEDVDRTEARLTRDQPLPRRLAPVGKRRDKTNARYDDATHSTLPTGRVCSDAFLDETHGVANGGDLLLDVVRNFDAELFFEGHHEFDEVERVRSEIVDEAGFFVDLFGVHFQALDHDFLHALDNVGHIIPFQYQGPAGPELPS